MINVLDMSNPDRQFFDISIFGKIPDCSHIQVGLDITTRSVPTQMVAISRKSLYRQLCNIKFLFQDFCRYNEMSLYGVVISRLTCTNAKAGNFQH